MGTQVSVVLPAYNEADNLVELVPETTAALRDAGVTFDINPYFADVNQPLPKFEHYHSQGVRKAAIATAVEMPLSHEHLTVQDAEAVAAAVVQFRQHRALGRIDGAHRL